MWSFFWCLILYSDLLLQLFFFITNTSKKANRGEGGVGWGCIIWHCNLTRILFGNQIVWQIKFRLTIIENKKKEKSFWWTPSTPLRVHKLLFWLLLTGFYILSDVHWKIFQWLLETSSSWFLVGLATCDWYHMCAITNLLNMRSRGFKLIIVKSNLLNISIIGLSLTDYQPQFS